MTWLDALPDEWFIPRWLSMDGGTPNVYAIDYLKSLAANRPILETAY